MTSRRKWGVKRGGSNLASNKISKCSPHPNTQSDSQSYVKKRKGGRGVAFLGFPGRGEGDRSDLEEKKEHQKGGE